MQGPIKVVDVYGDILPVSRSWLEEEIRQGRLSPHTGVQYGPWTGEAFLPAGELSALQALWDEPNAALSRQLLRRSPAWLSHAVSLLILVVGLTTLLVDAQLLSAQDWIHALKARGPTGFEPLVFEGAWASPWLSQLVHGGPDHLFVNLAVLGYCGYRVERAHGAQGFAAIAASSLGFGALAIALFEPVPVVGSSILAFGLWGAQIATGFRFGDSLPPTHRKYYGYGNLLAFAVLWAGSLRHGGVSHWGHLGGLLGGAGLVMLWKPAVHWRRGGQAGTLALSVALTGLTLGLGPLLRALPNTACGLPQRVLVEEAGLSLGVPHRMLPEGFEDSGESYRHTIMDEPAWRTGPASSEAVYAGTARMVAESLVAGDLLQGPDLLSYLERRYGIQGELVDIEMRPVGPGWTVQVVEFTDQGNGERYRLVDHHLPRGRWLTRLGYIVALRGGQPGPRGQVFERIVRSVEEGELPSLAHARAEHERNPSSRRLRMELGAALIEAGEAEGAAQLYRQLLEEDAEDGEAAWWLAHAEGIYR
jgi:rhomboid protease GluP